MSSSLRAPPSSISWMAPRPGGIRCLLIWCWRTDGCRPNSGGGCMGCRHGIQVSAPSRNQQSHSGEEKLQTRRHADGTVAGYEQASASLARGGIVRRDPVAHVHPLVREHPVTGEKALYVNSQCELLCRDECVQKQDRLTKEHSHSLDRRLQKRGVGPPAQLPIQPHCDFAGLPSARTLGARNGCRMGCKYPIY